jgi:hypothetical protein
MSRANSSETLQAFALLESVYLAQALNVANGTTRNAQQVNDMSIKYICDPMTNELASHPFINNFQYIYIYIYIYIYTTIFEYKQLQKKKNSTLVIIFSIHISTNYLLYSLFYLNIIFF